MWNSRCLGVIVRLYFVVVLCCFPVAVAADQLSDPAAQPAVNGAINAVSQTANAIAGFRGGAVRSTVSRLSQQAQQLSIHAVVNDQCLEEGYWDYSISQLWPYGAIYASAAAPDGFYVGGKVQSIGRLSVNHVAHWNGTTWKALGSGVNGPVYALAAASDGGVWAAGEFDVAGGRPALGVALWSNGEWSVPYEAPEGVLAAELTAVAVDGETVYVGGRWITPEGSKHGVAKIENGSWTWLGSAPEFDWFINVLEVGGGRVYVGGRFEEIGGVTIRRLAQWDGDQWTDVGGSVDFHELRSQVADAFLYTAITALAYDERTQSLYAGGSFRTIGGMPARNVARWDGIRWTAFDGGIPGIATGSSRSWYVPVSAIALNGLGEMFVAGDFTGMNDEWNGANLIPATRIGKWDGKEWSSLEGGLTGLMPYRVKVASPPPEPGGVYPEPPFQTGPHIMTLTYHRGRLLVGGTFTDAGGQASLGMAMWVDPRRPRLRVHESDGGSVLSWPEGAEGYALQMKEGGEGEWQNVTRTRELMKGEWNLSLAEEAGDEVRFYRLVKSCE